MAHMKNRAAKWFKQHPAIKIYLSCLGAVFLCFIIPLIVFVIYMKPHSVTDILQEISLQFDQLYGDGWSFFPHILISYIIQCVHEIRELPVAPTLDATSLTTTSTLVTSILTAAIGTVIDRKNNQRYGYRIEEYTEYQRIYVFTQIIRLMSIVFIVASLCCLITDRHLYAAVICTTNFGFSLSMVIVSIYISDDKLWRHASEQKYREVCDSPVLWKEHVNRFIKEFADGNGAGSREAFASLIGIFLETNARFEKAWLSGIELDEILKKLLVQFCAALRAVFEVLTTPELIEQYSFQYRNYRVRKENMQDLHNLFETVDIFAYFYISAKCSEMRSNEDKDYRRCEVVHRYLQKQNCDHPALYDQAKVMLFEQVIASTVKPELGSIVNYNIVSLSNYEKRKYSDLLAAAKR